MRKSYFMAVTFALVTASFNAFAGDRTCQCRLQTGDTWVREGTIIKTYGNTTVTTGTGSDTAEKKCSRQCQDKAKADYDNGSAAQASCAKVGSNTRVYAASKAGTIPAGGYDHFLGTIQNSAAVYKCQAPGHVLSGSNCSHTVAVTKKCPAGWMANPTNEVAGITTDGLCKRQVPGCQLTAPVPSNGTQIAGYGFTWGNGVYQMSNASNGGAAIVSCPAGYNISGNNCIKAYAATLVSPAVCKWQ